ncbi:hypothetical protein PR202_gb06968 [Eleusine coracana subsp. coracana]|uniref:Uncharacterized protein n=1 Tax=Eleusine coracana subsp. coracana TaxID=191504 RepID=A0AAV5EA90_ELECO|nr:hypothetical protein PR202_gb06968 [Eleusine coracana subsp. coracana]
MACNCSSSSGDVKPSVGKRYLLRGYNDPIEGVKPAEAPGGGAASGRRVDDDAAVVSRQFRSKLRTLESIAGLRATHSIPDTFALLPAGPNQAACDPPMSDVSAAGVPIPVYTESLAAGMRLPLDPFVSSALTHYAESAQALFAGLPSSGKAWKEEFLLVAPPPGAPWPCPVRWGVPSKEAMSDPVLTKGEADVVRQLAQASFVYY